MKLAEASRCYKAKEKLKVTLTCTGVVVVWLVDSEWRMGNSGLCILDSH